MINVYWKKTIHNEEITFLSYLGLNLLLILIIL